MFKTEFPFCLPRGYVDDEGHVHRHGMMRLATARDEIVPLQDPRARRNPAYLMIITLSRVITKLGLGDVNQISVETIERLYATDLAYLQDHYRKINELDSSTQRPDDDAVHTVAPAADAADDSMALEEVEDLEPITERLGRIRSDRSATHAQLA
jgi:hypothetical protein